MLKKVIVLVSLLNLGFCFSQKINDVNGNPLNYRKVGNLYWTDNISTTKMWGTKRNINMVTSAPMPDLDYGGGYYIDQNSIPIFSNRVYLNYEGDFYYTWNTANNFTAFKEITTQKKYNQINNSNIDNSNSSICPCGWRVPSLDDVSDLLVATKVFNSQEEFRNWIFDKGLFDSKFMFNSADAYVIKEDINPSVLENKLFLGNEFDGIFGMQGSDKYKPLKKDEMFSMWLSNIGASAGTDMQIDGLGLYIAKNKNNKLSLVIKPFMSSQMMSVKCVSDDKGLKKYEEWIQNLKLEADEEKSMESYFDSLLLNKKFTQAYDFLKNKFKDDLPEIEKWTEADKKKNDFFEAIGRGEIIKENGVDVYAYGRCDKYYECQGGRQANSLYCKGHNEKVKNSASLSLSSKLYNNWNSNFKKYVSELLSQKTLNESKNLIDFYSKKQIYINKKEEENQINLWNDEIAFIENDILINELKKKALTQTESLFTGKWHFESNDVSLENGVIVKMEEDWVVNNDRTYVYSSKFKRVKEGTYFLDYLEKGIFEIQSENDGVYVIAHITEEKGKASKRIDKMKFEKLSDKKASRTLNVNGAKSPLKLKGEKL